MALVCDGRFDAAFLINSHSPEENQPMPNRVYIRTVLFVALSGYFLGCGEETLPPIADLGMAPPMVVFDSGTGGNTRCEIRPEVCNLEDDDCDGRIDEEEDVRVQVFSDPNHCGACGDQCEGPNAIYACQVGECVIAACSPGYVDYNGEPEDGCEADCIITAGGREVCDEQDNDCDGSIDEDFDLSSDLLNCGRCGTVCGEVRNGVQSCLGGQCQVDGCATDWHDLNEDPSDGCEYACVLRASDTVREQCNGLDDDCDGFTDEVSDLRAPEFDCGELGVCGSECEADDACPDGDRCTADGVCAPVDFEATPCDVDRDCLALHPGLACISQSERIDGEWVTQRTCRIRTKTPMCDGEFGYRCARSRDWQRGDEQGRCDALDNDCDGRVDEDYIEQLFLADRRTARPCVSGIGECRNPGVVECRVNGDGTQCSTDPLNPPSLVDDTCDGYDEDCDGIADEDFVDAVVEVAGVQIYAYEASRPGATVDAVGRDENPADDIVTYLSGRACSRPGVLPWNDVTWSDARDACEAAGARLCTTEEWFLACGGEGGQSYPYGNSFRSNLCNGQGFDADPEVDGNQDESVACGVIQSCQRDGVYDLSGNLKEWTSDTIGNLRAVRGGGYSTVLAGGMTCEQDNDWKDRRFHHRSIGFRCCRD